MRERLLRGAAGGFFVQGGRLISELLLSILLARLLGPDGYGTYAFAFAIVKVVQIPAENGFANLAVRFTSAYKAVASWGLLRGLWRRTFSAAFAYGIITAAVLLFIALSGIDSSKNKTLAAASILLLFMPLISSGGGVLRGLGRTVLGQAPEHIIRPVAFLFLCVLSFLFAGKFIDQPSHAMMLHGGAVFFSMLAAFGWYLRYKPKEIRNAAPAYEDKTWLKAVLPLSFIGGMFVVNQHMDILILGWLSPAAQVGIYRISVQGANLVIFGLMVINFVIAPEISRLYVKGEKKSLQKMVTWSARAVLACALPIAIIFWLLGKQIISFAFGEEYQASYAPLAVLTLGQLVNAAAGSVGFILNMTGHEKDTAVGVTIAAILNIFLNLMLIPSYQAIGAAIATVSSMIVWNILLIWAVYKRIQLNSTAFGRISPRRPTST
ncbi:flippase [Desulfovermiculus halophilus]|uniref:flippase n=1 Tax=Desulfovermiculus halophilus TaxID=339722 RepID=UPI0005528CC0|nr:flippase [Desulfovermiculus halophilus]